MNYTIASGWGIKKIIASPDTSGRSNPMIRDCFAEFTLNVVNVFAMTDSPQAAGIYS
jgi:hypothetical protein